MFISEIVFNFQSVLTLICDWHYPHTSSVDLNPVWCMWERRWRARAEQFSCLGSGGSGGALIGQKLIMGGGSGVKLRGGSFSWLFGIELSLKLVLLIACVDASLGWLDALSLMMMYNGWDLRTQSVCVSRESLTELVIDVCGWEDVRRADCWLVSSIVFCINLCYLTYVLLNSFFDISMWIPNIEAVTAISFTRYFIHCSSGSTEVAIATVSTYPIHFVIPWAVTWMATEVGICYAPQQFTFEITK